MCERSMLPMRHTFAEPAPINHTDHHRWRDPERVLRFEAAGRPQTADPPAARVASGSGQER
jgi:hypothetical protein